MRTISELTEYLFGTRSAPARDSALHERTEHRHWDRQTQSWVDHGQTDGGERAA
jgi:hypothetical protein